MSAADVEVVREAMEAFNRRNYERMSGFERGFQYLPEEVVDCGERVFARVVMRGTGRGSGVELEREIFHVYEVRGGKILKIQVFWSEDEARKTAGLKP